MPRTLTDAAAAQAERRDGAYAVYLLRIDFGGDVGVRWYSDERVDLVYAEDEPDSPEFRNPTAPVLPIGDLTTSTSSNLVGLQSSGTFDLCSLYPHLCEIETPAAGDEVIPESRVVSWGDIPSKFDAKNLAGFNQISIELRDDDFALREIIDKYPGIQGRKAWIYLFFIGTTWPTDRIRLLSGTIGGGAEWSMEGATWRITINDMIRQRDEELGRKVTADIWPMAPLTGAEGDLLPIVFGKNVRRVRAVRVCQPAIVTTKDTRISPQATSFLVEENPEDSGFKLAELVDVIVGSEWMRGYFELVGGAGGRFNIITRSQIVGQGQVSLGGDGTVTIPARSFRDFDSIDEADLIGAPIFFWRNDTNEWLEYAVSSWTPDIASAQVGFTVPNDFTGSADTEVETGAPFKLLFDNSWVSWPRGTPVVQIGLWIYVANMLPSKLVRRVEGWGRVDEPTGNQREQYITIENPPSDKTGTNDVAYSFNRNDQTWSGVGHNMTVIYMPNAPSQMNPNIKDDDIYVTLDGIEDVGDGEGNVIEDPALVLLELLTNPALGAVPADDVDIDSFGKVMAEVTTKFAFAITEDVQLAEVAADLAFQCGCAIFWDRGKITLQKIELYPQNQEPALTVTESNSDAHSFVEQDIQELVSKVTGKWRKTSGGHRVPEDEDQRVSRGAAAVAANFKKVERTIELWAYNERAHVEQITQFWAQYWSSIYRRATFTMFLDALPVQPLDALALNVRDGNGLRIYGTVDPDNYIVSPNDDGNSSAGSGAVFCGWPPPTNPDDPWFATCGGGDDADPVIPSARVIELSHQPGSARDARIDAIAFTVEWPIFTHQVDPVDEADTVGCVAYVNYTPQGSVPADAGDDGGSGGGGEETECEGRYCAPYTPAANPEDDVWTLTISGTFTMNGSYLCTFKGSSKIGKCEHHIYGFFDAVQRISVQINIAPFRSGASIDLIAVDNLRGGGLDQEIHETLFVSLDRDCNVSEIKTTESTQWSLSRG